ncbi:rhodanese-related sulfurtransferase [Maricaulis parjimensis]|uniref:oxygen-dependent tRNA uridine(34) hydroxylase TrhO n=1 Tax=Maricaulis parjimensis TaxID=144023 RepID=UPI00193A72B9|nr:rhodanese-related sulfurtransferase [Maricaulis parjimensis]
MSDYLIAALYKFTPLKADADLQARIHDVCAENQVAGTLLLAPEGLNGTIAGPETGLRTVLEFLRGLPGCRDLEHKESRSEDQPFLRLKVRLKREIVTMGVPGIDPNETVGTYVEPEDWNDLIQAPDVVTIDTRNDYEVRIGQFAGAVDPHTTTFREFPDWFRRFRETRPNARIAMYCTGGIRCEKATAFVKQEGIEDVFHLKGGILKYLETVPAEDSLWQGECFVFDRRVAVGHGLAEGTHSLCHACREPLGAEDRASPLFIEGESCPYCHDARDAAQREGYAERHRQEILAQARGERHVGRKAEAE